MRLAASARLFAGLLIVLALGGVALPQARAQDGETVAAEVAPEEVPPPSPGPVDCATDASAGLGEVAPDGVVGSVDLGGAFDCGATVDAEPTDLPIDGGGTDEVGGGEVSAGAVGEGPVDGEPAPAGETAPPAGDESGGDTGGDPQVTQDGEHPDSAPIEEGEVAPVPASEEVVAATDEVEVVPATVTVRAFTCAADPGGDPVGAGCTPVDGVKFDATADGTSLGTFTTVGGASAVTTSVGAALTITQDLSSAPGGYLPLGSGVVGLNPVSGDATLDLIHVAAAVMGRLQIVNGSCPTSGDERTEFQVIEPNMVAAAETACVPTAGAVFTITGGVLPAGGLAVTTGSDGAWRGYLAAGNYTVVDDSGASVGVTVAAEEIVVVIAVDFFNPPTGLLTVSKFACTEGDEEGTEFAVGAQEAGPGCDPADGEFAIEEVGDGTQAGDVDTFSLGPDGYIELPLPPGAYELTDLGENQSATVDVRVAETTATMVRTTTLRGKLVVRHYLCADPDSNGQDPSNPTYWQDECVSPYGGAVLQLLSNRGAHLDQQTGSAGGVITWSNLLRGGYGLGSSEGFCAAFAGGVDARSGFTVQSGETLLVKVYTCAARGGNIGGGDDGTGGVGNGGSGDGTTGGESPDGSSGDGTEQSGSDSLGDDGDDLDETASVTTLPQTGARPAGTAATPWLAFALVGGAVGLGGAVTVRARDRRAA